MHTATLERPPAGDVRELSMLIGGEWVQAQSGRTFESVDPFTGEVWATAPEAGVEDVDAAVRAARAALNGPWGRTNGRDRARLMRRLADLIVQHAPHLAVIESLDNGKLLRETAGQMEAIPEWYLYFAGAADKLHGETIPTDKENFFVYTVHEPIGVVAGIVPWNSPLMVIAYKLAPALAAGCTFVVKSAEQTPASALEFGSLFEEAGFPPGVFNVLTGHGEPAGAALASHPDVDRVSFTGSSQTGTKVMQAAAEHMAAVTLELGGKSPNIVFEDADLDGAANGVVSGIFAAAGQTCIAGSRLLVQRSVHGALVDRLRARAEEIKLGDPLEPATEMGPIAFMEQLEKVRHYIDIGQEEGASLASGGGSPATAELGRGFFIEPTILTGVRNDMRVAQEEIFGPVLAVIPFDDEEDAVRIANDTQYGLAAGVWTKDVHRAHRMAKALHAGTVWVNAYRVVSFQVPFGGNRMSGVGRENGLEGLREFTSVKAVWVELSGNTRDPFRMG